ncbi:MAG: formate dehydrogenase accessory sulfurtransferase FdhD [Hyphomicrobium sp.]
MTSMANSADIADAVAEPLCSVPAEGVGVDAGGKEASVTWQLPEEVAVAVQINTEPYTVMMATPANLIDFGRGFVLAEGIVPQSRRHPRRHRHAGRERLGRRRRHRRGGLGRGAHAAPLARGRSGCGLCGVENIADVVRITQPVPTTVRPIRRGDPQGRTRVAEAADHEPLQPHGARRSLGLSRRGDRFRARGRRPP